MPGRGARARDLARIGVRGGGPPADRRGRHHRRLRALDAGDDRLTERNAAILAGSHLPECKATVSFEVCVKHVAGATEGARCVAAATLREVVDGRKLRFEVEV